MARVPYLERDQLPPDLQSVYDATQKAIGRVPNFHKVLAHSPKALTGYLALGGALREMRLDAKLRELAYLKTSQLNHCHYWFTHHTALGQRVGLTNGQIEGLSNYASNPAYGDLERLVLRYAEQLTIKVDTDEALHAELKKYLSDREIVELAVTVATANFTNRVNDSLKTELEHERPWKEAAMEIVRIPEAHELVPEDRRFLEATKAWFKIDFVPKMSRVLLTVPEFGRPYARASRRAMADGALSRAQKELIAAMVSAINVCEYWTVAHSAAWKLQGFAEDLVWYEVAYVAGVTHGLNAVADGLHLPLDFSPSSRTALLPPIDPGEAAPEVKAVFEEIMAFYGMDRPPAVFRWMARDAGFFRDYWAATREAFTDRKLDRVMKELLALAASLTAKSDYGVDFHLREVRRLGLSDQALTEAIEVVQCFNTVTKIADALQLQPDFNPRAAG